MADVFLSYSRHDQQVADRIDERLRSGGRTVFLDRRRLEANAPWEPVLEGELQAARCVLVLWSTASIKSQWVRKEANSGYMRKRLVQALIHNVSPPQPFAGLQAVNLVELADDSLADLAVLTQAIDVVIRLPAGAPDEVGKELDSLVLRLDQYAPQKQIGENLMIATWNIRSFGGLTSAWTATKADSPARDRRSLIAIAEIVRRFDLTVVQEVRGDLEAFNYLMTILGEEWSGLTLESDSNPSTANGEMTALIFDARRIMPRGLFDRLMPLQELELNGSQDLDQLLLNRPYGAFFRTRITDPPTTFGIIILRVLYGHDRPVEQLSRLGAWLREWATAEESAGRSLMLVGDFGIDRLDDPAFQALRGAGLWVPPELDSAPRTIFRSGSPYRQFVDHIAFMRDDDGEPVMSLNYTGRGGFFDFMESVYSKETPARLSWRISDHYPIWLELSTGHQTKGG